MNFLSRFKGGFLCQALQTVVYLHSQSVKFLKLFSELLENRSDSASAMTGLREKGNDK